VRNAIARFDQVTGVPPRARDAAWANIKKAAAHYGVEVSEKSWRELGVHPQRGRKQRAKRATTTRNNRRTPKAPAAKTRSRKSRTRKASSSK